MLVRLLLYIKHHLTFIWQLVEWLNSSLFKLLYGRRIEKIIPEILKVHDLPGFSFQRLYLEDLPALKLLLDKQARRRLDYFRPHGFDEKTLLKVSNNPAFIMLGVYKGPDMVGYFFLRCFWNSKCFVGRLIDENWEGKGVGRVMNNIMYDLGWSSGFRIFATISKNNHMVMRSHANNPAIVVLRELKNDFLLVEFLKER
jgi:hypothetical protein